MGFIGDEILPSFFARLFHKPKKLGIFRGSNGDLPWGPKTTYKILSSHPIHLHTHKLSLLFENQLGSNHFVFAQIYIKVLSFQNMASDMIYIKVSSVFFWRIGFQKSGNKNREEFSKHTILVVPETNIGTGDQKEM